jgi:hypothetical protein
MHGFEDYDNTIPVDIKRKEKIYALPLFQGAGSTEYVVTYWKART